MLGATRWHHCSKLLRLSFRNIMAIGVIFHVDVDGSGRLTFRSKSSKKPRVKEPTVVAGKIENGAGLENPCRDIRGLNRAQRDLGRIIHRFRKYRLYSLFQSAHPTRIAVFAHSSKHGGCGDMATNIFDQSGLGEPCGFEKRVIQFQSLEKPDGVYVLLTSLLPQMAATKRATPSCRGLHPSLYEARSKPEHGPISVRCPSSPQESSLSPPSRLLSLVGRF